MRWESSNELYHYGIKGQKHGVRNYQNEDGTLTDEGRARYGHHKLIRNKFNDLNKKMVNRRNEKAKKRNETAKDVEKKILQAERLEKQSNAAFKNAKEMRKGLGKNVFQRIRAVRDAEKGKGTDEAKAYVKEFDRASRLGDKAYDIKLNASKDFKSLGKTKFSRVHTMNKNNRTNKMWKDIDKFDNKQTIKKLGDSRWEKANAKKVEDVLSEEDRNKKRYKELNRMARRGY